MFLTISYDNDKKLYYIHNDDMHIKIYMDKEEMSILKNNMEYYLKLNL